MLIGFAIQTASRAVQVDLPAFASMQYLTIDDVVCVFGGSQDGSVLDTGIALVHPSLADDSSGVLAVL